MYFLTARQVAERVSLVEAELRELGREEVQRNVIVLRTQVTDDRPAALDDYSRFLRGTLSPGQVGHLPAVLIGNPEEIAEQVLARHERCCGESPRHTHPPALDWLGGSRASSRSVSSTVARYHQKTQSKNTGS